MQLEPRYVTVNAVDHSSLSRDLAYAGAVLLRDPGTRVNDFMRFSDKLGSDFVSFGGKQCIIGGNSGRQCVAGYDSLFTVSGTSNSGYGHEVALHGELYFHHHRPPELLWFFCRKPALCGGETLLCDGAELFDALPQEIRAALSRRDILYERNHDQATWKRLYCTDSVETLKSYCLDSGIDLTVHQDGGITTRFVCSPLRHQRNRTVFINNLLPFALRMIREPERTGASVRFADGETIPVDWVLTMESVANEIARPVSWQAGDIVIVDNSRILHGRRALTDSERTVYIRMSGAGVLHWHGAGQVR